MRYVPVRSAKLLLLDDEGVVFCRAQQKLYALNTTACVVWLWMEMELDEASIAARYRDTFCIDTHQAQSVVRRMLCQWHELALITAQGQVLPCAASASREPTPAARCHSEHVRQSCWSETVYRLLGSAIRVEYTSQEQYLCAHPAFEHLQAGGAASIPERIISISNIDDTFHLMRDGRCEAVAGSLNCLTATLKSLILQTAVNAFDFLVYFHAGALERNGACVLLPAAAGSGKSTLTAALLRHGYRYLSDEVALLARGDFEVPPTPLSIGLKRGSWEILSPLYPQLRGLQTHYREDLKAVRYLPPPSTAAVRAEASYPVRTIIFPGYDPSSRTSLQPVSRVAALQHLFDDCVAISGELTFTEVERLVSWIKSIDCHRLIVNDLDEAVRHVNDTQGVAR